LYCYRPSPDLAFCAALTGRWVFCLAVALETHMIFSHSELVSFSVSSTSARTRASQHVQSSRYLPLSMVPCFIACLPFQISVIFGCDLSFQTPPIFCGPPHSFHHFFFFFTIESSVSCWLLRVKRPRTLGLRVIFSVPRRPLILALLPHFRFRFISFLILDDEAAFPFPCAARALQAPPSLRLDFRLGSPS